MAKKLSQQEAEQKIKDYNNEYELTSIYTKGTEKAKIKHKCGHEYEIKRYKSFFEDKNKCPICYPYVSSRKSTKPLTEKDIIDRIKEQTGDEYSYLNGYKNTKTKMKVKHNTCGHEFNVSPDMFFNKQTRCPICSNKNRGKYAIKENYLIDILNEAKDGNEYEWKEGYKNNNKIKLEILHKTCNRTYKVRPNDFQQGYRCPYCSEEKSESYYVTYIKNYFKHNKITFNTEITFEGLIYKSKLRFDFKVNNLLIEFDGIQHFKSTYSLGDYIKTKKRDSIKNQWIQGQKDYSFIRIPSKISYEDLDKILNKISNNSLKEKDIIKHNLYYYDSNSDKVYNSYSYYTNINENYFTEKFS